MTHPAQPLDDGEHVVVSTRTHAKASVGPALALRVEKVRLLVAEERHTPSSGQRSDDGT